jgi:ABC-2 type transport system ATP-binding protein
MEATVVLENVGKRLRKKVLLEGVSFTLDPGQVGALLGENASGKSTLFAILAGYCRSTYGMVRLLGEAPGSAKLIGRIGVAPELVQLPSGVSVKALLHRLATWQFIDDPDGEVERLLDLFQLSRWRDESARSLSKGVGRRVVVAQAFLGRPEVLLLDEPTAGLDASAAKRLLDILREHSDRGATVLVSCHDAQWVESLHAQSISLDGHAPSTLDRTAGPTAASSVDSISTGLSAGEEHL